MQKENQKEILENSSDDKKQGVRDTLYGSTDVSVETMDKVITGLLIALGLAIMFGVIL